MSLAPRTIQRLRSFLGPTAAADLEAGLGGPAGVGDKLAANGRVFATPTDGLEVLLTADQNLIVMEEQGDSIVINGDGRLVVAEGVYAACLTTEFSDIPGTTDHGDATQIFARLSDYQTPSWGPNLHAAVANDRTSCVVSGTWAFPEGDILNFYFGHNATTPRDMSYNLWIIKVG